MHNCDLRYTLELYTFELEEILSWLTEIYLPEIPAELAHMTALETSFVVEGVTIAEGCGVMAKLYGEVSALYEAEETVTGLRLALVRHCTREFTSRLEYVAETETER